MLAVPEMVRMRPEEVGISMARLKELPYAGAGHCSGEPISSACGVSCNGCIARAPRISAVPRGLRAPMPVLAGSEPVRNWMP